MIPPPSIEPSASYISISNSIPSKAQKPTRKLLVLDLNGTLLLRPKPRNRVNRPILIRPYMSTFCSYLFHESVRLWLDVMVWSSAQPQNVDAMVKKCFKENKSDLRAIWARDTLDLDRKLYNRKVQTIKDLEKPWKELALPIAHTAASTLLMDDSPLKTRLQPFNHLCVSEYTSNIRNMDRNAHKQRNNSVNKFQYDSTLLAAIGILEELKYQTNVAAWLRSGGLWASHGPPPKETEFQLFTDSETTSGSDQSIPEQEILWFEHTPCFDYWVEKGKEAATQLQITLDAGFAP